MAKKKSIQAKKKFDLATYPYAECREAHDLQPYDGSIVPKDKLAYQTKKCSRCGTKRHRVISMRTADYGDVLRSSYVYPKDYQVVGGLDHSDRGRIRIANFLATLELHED